MHNRYHVIIAAAGMGLRLNQGKPKGLVTYKNKALILHTLDAFLKFKDHIASVFICVPKTHKDTFKNLLNHHHLAPRLICGSNTRAKSVYEAVKQLPDNGFVLIHDGARPFAHTSIQALINCPLEHKAVIPTLAMTDTLKEVTKNYVIKSHTREHFFRVQTPQRFCIKTLKKAYQLCSWDQFSDESQLFEAIKKPVFCIPGDPKNKKITFPDDLS